jgi:hypothetical protein
MRVIFNVLNPREFQISETLCRAFEMLTALLVDLIREQQKFLTFRVL